MISCKRALPDFLEMNQRCNTWQQLTEEERYRFLEVVIYHTESRLFGTYDQRFKILNAIYDAYLIGLGKDVGVLGQ